MEILIGGLSGVIAMVATNPLEVVKVRMQLQGEGEKHGSHQRPYKNVFHGLYTIAKTEGILALQRGLLAAAVFGFCINGLRLGLYKLADNRSLTRKENGELAFHKTVICSSISGGIAGAATTPLTIVKTRLQAMTQMKNISVGKAKYNYTGMLDAYRQIYKNEGGIKGLFAGAKASGMRIALGSSSQLTTFSTAKEFLYYHGICQDSKFGLAFLASFLSAIINALVVCPLDVATIRLYSQGDKKLYNGLMDCLKKIFKVEGIYGLYKGFGPLYFRLAPLTILSLVIWDLLNHLLVPNNKSV